MSLELVFVKRGTVSKILFLIVSSLLLVGFFAVPAMAGIPGGISERKPGQNSPEIEEFAKFAVAEHNKKENKNLEFVKLVSVHQQVVAGLMYFLTIEANSGGETGHYEAKVWSKPWANHKSVEDFKFLGPKLTSADLGTLGHGGGGGESSGLTSISVDDPSVTEAAENALKSIQRNSNSLFPYELKEIISAHAERKDGALFKVLMKLKRGTREENCNAEIHCNEEGDWKLNSYKIE